MARKGVGFFDSKGQFFRSPEEATISDLAALLGRIGDGESLAPGIATTLLTRREDIEALFREHDAMVESYQEELDMTLDDAANVEKLPVRDNKAS
jgi:hypothetical protein